MTFKILFNGSITARVATSEQVSAILETASPGDRVQVIAPSGCAATVESWPETKSLQFLAAGGIALRAKNYLDTRGACSSME